MDSEERKSLETFLLHNPELERLEALLSQFNIFEALRAVHQEIRHSDFLGFLLSPQENHGLREVFLRRFLQLAVANSQHVENSIGAIELEALDLSGVEILREWNSIDLLIRDERNRLVVIVENKIATGEHSDQLARYCNLVSQEFKGWHKLAFYLTPDGDKPSSVSYLAISYELISNLLGDIVESRASSISPDVRTFILHYIQMLRRHILSESEIAKLCISIYKKHKPALDLIYEHRPDLQAALKEFLSELVARTDGLLSDSSSKAYVRFIPEKWDLPQLRVGEGWTPSGRILLFEFQNFRDSLKLRLFIGPGQKQVRERLFQMAKGEGHPFKSPSKELSPRWNTIFDRPFLSAKDYNEVPEDELKTRIERLWKEFLDSDLPKISTILQKQKWPEK